VSISRGLNFDGSHFENNGIDADGNVIEVPSHYHDVSLDIFRVVFQVDYTFEEPWAIRTRVPIEQRSRMANIVDIDPSATAEEIEAMERNLAIHHPPEILSGFGDVELLLSWHAHDFGMEGGSLAIAAGSTLPTGRTEDDPYALGEVGERHEHIQFGTGTFDPLIEFNYGRPIGDDGVLSLFGQGRFPITESSKGFRGSNLIQGGLGYIKGLGEFGPWDDVNGVLGIFYQNQGRAEWNGVIDRNTGFQSYSLQLGLSWWDESMTSWNLSLVLPLKMETPDESLDTYDPGPLINLAIGF